MKIAIVVDMQYDFLAGGSLAVNKSDIAVSNTSKRLANNKYNTIFLTADFHPWKHSSFSENGGTWPVHCVQHTHGAAIESSILSAAHSHCSKVKVVTKGDNPKYEEYSIFQNYVSSVFIQNVLNVANKDELVIEVLGIAGDYCVLNTIKDLVSLGFKDNIVVISDCIASIDGGEALTDYCNSNSIKMI